MLKYVNVNFLSSLFVYSKALAAFWYFIPDASDLYIWVSHVPTDSSLHCIDVEALRQDP